MAAVRTGVGYFCVGPTWPTPSKPGQQAPGLPMLRRARRCWAPTALVRHRRRPNLDEVLEAGATRVVVVRALTEAADPHAAAVGLATRLAHL